MPYVEESTEEIWGKFNSKRGAKRNESVTVCVGIGKTRSKGQIPACPVPDDVDSDYSEQLIENNTVEHSPEIHTKHTYKSR